MNSAERQYLALKNCSKNQLEYFTGPTANSLFLQSHWILSNLEWIPLHGVAIPTTDRLITHACRRPFCCKQSSSLSQSHLEAWCTSYIRYRTTWAKAAGTELSLQHTTFYLFSFAAWAGLHCPSGQQWFSCERITWFAGRIWRLNQINEVRNVLGI